MYCTDPERPVAIKVHLCQSCGARIEAGQRYVRWRYFDNGNVGTVKMHPECHDMHCEDAEHGPWEFTPFGHERPSVQA